MPSPTAGRGVLLQNRESKRGLREGISSEGRGCVDLPYCLVLPVFSWLSSKPPAPHPAGMELLCSCGGNQGGILLLGTWVAMESISCPGCGDVWGHKGTFFQVVQPGTTPGV